MEQDLYSEIEKENINYINTRLENTRGAIIHYRYITAIIVDDEQIKAQTSENTVLMQELGHYYAGSYYRTTSPYSLIEKMEHKADVASWKKFIPYQKVRELLSKGFSNMADLADYFGVEAPYMARCIYFYSENSNHFNNKTLTLI